MENERPVEKLTAGKDTELKIKFKVEKDADYILLEVPIPSGCSYTEGQAYQSFECYRENFKEKVCIFYSKLKAGNYETSVKLQVRYGGRFVLNPARMEMMYVPTFYGRNGIQKIDVLMK